MRVRGLCCLTLVLVLATGFVSVAGPAVAQSVKVTVSRGSGSGLYAVGNTVQIRASSPRPGYRFKAWRTIGAAVADPTRETTSLTVPSGATRVSLIATYERTALRPVRLFVIGGVGTGVYSAGTPIAISAETRAGYQFNGWRATNAVVADPSAASTTVTVSGPARGRVEALYVAAQNDGGDPDSGPGSQDITLTSHEAGGNVSFMGETVFGTVRDPGSVASLVVTVSTSNRSETLTVDRATGLFALRLFPGETTEGGTVALRFETTRSNGAAASTEYAALKGRNMPAALQMVAGRLTFGATPALIAELKSKGYEAWVSEQLDPDTIDDSAFDAMNIDNLFAGATADYDLYADVYHANLLRAVHTKKQLREVMTTFWDNHFWSRKEFGGDARKDMNAFRSKALGKFRDLLQASAKSPAMLVFLDNNVNARGANNENYARELLELHTVGVDAGYGDDDIKAVAKVMSGWGRRFLNSAAPYDIEFYFTPVRHDLGDKTVPFLNVTIQGRDGADGVLEGEELLDILAGHPSTKRFVCGKIVAALVADSRPIHFVDRCVEAWTASDGTVKDMLAAILLDPLYLTTVSIQKSKAKTPFEYFTGYLRNFAAAPLASSTAGLRNYIVPMRTATQNAGMNWMTHGVPTGFKDAPEDWMTMSSLIQRFTDVQAYQRIRGSLVDTRRSAILDFRMILRDAGMSTPEAAGAYLLALAAADRFQKDEYDAVVAKLKGSSDFDLNQPASEDRVRAAVDLLMTLPSVQLQ